MSSGPYNYAQIPGLLVIDDRPYIAKWCPDMAEHFRNQAHRSTNMEIKATYVALADGASADANRQQLYGYPLPEPFNLSGFSSYDVWNQMHTRHALDPLPFMRD